jgi:RimJ/RimL family protein N-acetyltransferase
MKKLLETDRFILRELKIDDKYELSKILSDKESMKYYPHPFTDIEVENWINWNIDNYKKYNHGLWAVILKENNIFLGDCGITMQEIEDKKLPELGFHIKKEYNNHGYATEAAKACIDFAFKELNIKTLYSYTTTDNLPSQKVAQKIGMKFVKKFNKIIYGKIIEEILYSITKDL